MANRKRVLALLLALWGLCPAPAVACDLSPIATAPSAAAIELDFHPQSLEVQRQYRFETGTDGSVTVFRDASLTFNDFMGAYVNFVEARAVPGNTCDVIRIGDYEMAVDPSGLAIGSFEAYFENNFCFMLRFFKPLPGVRRDSMHQLIKQGTLGVQNAFQPVMQNGLLSVQMATLYSTSQGASLEKLYDRPLTGFLEEESFMQLVAQAVSDNDPPGSPSAFTPADVRFAAAGDKVRLKISLKKSAAPEEACKLREEKLATGEWHASN